jgi:hypothetical protein
LLKTKNILCLFCSIALLIINGCSTFSELTALKIEAEVHEQLSNSTIYRRIEEDRQQGGKLHRKLPRFGKTRWKEFIPLFSAGLLFFSGVTIVVVSKVTSYRPELCVSPFWQEMAYVDQES